MLNSDNDMWARAARELAHEPPSGDVQEGHASSSATPIGDIRLAAEEVWAATANAAAKARRDRASAARNTDAAFARLDERMSAGGRRAGRVARPLRIRAGLAAAAVVAVVLSTTLLLRNAAPDAFFRYTTGAGQRSSIVLYDGSRVELRANSDLRVYSVPDRRLLSVLLRRPGAADSRVVELTGEAVFTVVHDANRPFRVIAGAGVAEDLGTVFSVRAYSDELRMRVAVTEGAVALSRRQGETLASDSAGPRADLSPGQVGTLDSSGIIAIERRDDLSDLFAWSRDRLVFRRQTLTTVVAELNRTFDGRVAVGDSRLGQRRVTLDMPLSTLDAAVNTLAALLQVDGITRGDSVLLMPRSFPSPH